MGFKQLSNIRVLDVSSTNDHGRISSDDLVDQQQLDRPSKAGIHHYTPALLIWSLSCGVGFALGHHFFYQSLDRKPALDGTVVLEVSQQQFNLAVGNAFAFAVKVSLGFAASTAYIQVFWRAMRNSQKGQRLHTLDTTFSALEDAWGLLSFQVWARYPLMFILACLAWCIPIASIVTPSTLSVQNVLRVPALTGDFVTPNLEFASLDFLAPMIFNGTYNWWQYFGSNDAVRRIATSTLYDGDILPISPPLGHANASWTTEFWGPSLTCANATQEVARAVWYNILDSIEPEGDSDPPRWACYGLKTYASWADNGQSWLPFNGYDMIDNSLSFGRPHRMFVAVMPWSQDQYQRLCGFGKEANILSTVYGKPDSAKDPYLPELFDSATLLECRAVNASYNVQFDYINGQQNLAIAVEKTDQPLIPYKNVTGPAVLNQTSSDDEAFQADCSTLNAQGIRCMFDVSTLRTLGYQAIVDSFTAVIHGTLSTTNPAVQRLIFYDSYVSNTRLMDTEELAWIPEYAYITPSKQDNLTSQMLSQAGSAYVGLSKSKPDTTQGSLGTVIEDLFTNFTMSLMSNPFLQPNYSSPFAPPAFHNVTLQDYHNVYAYHPATLWIAYGAAIGTTCAITALGLFLIYLNGASYDNKFSTVLRISRYGELSIPAHSEEDRDDASIDDGRRPLPRDMAMARLTLRRPGQLKREASHLMT